ncbi:MAG: class I tRNA ligase family protein, partial [Oscillospiraceae bacterium]|jgi:isoleucyl-tRNA synthetase|nr:class I tRNA ligase family protein [Oscillospiraceae bacterium]
MTELDRWALHRLNELVRRVRASYEKYEYHPIYHGIHNFCAVEMSSVYLDIIKDRLYCDDRAGASVKSAQSAIFLILDALTRLLAPILAFTAEEIWAAMPHRSGDDAESVLFNDMPSPDARFDLSDAEADKWDKLLALRGAVNRALEKARADKIIGKPLDAEVTLFFTAEARQKYAAALTYDLARLFIVSSVETADAEGGVSKFGVHEGGAENSGIEGLSAAVRASEAPRCARCWTHDELVGGDAEHPELCPRCAEVVRAMTSRGEF